MTYYVKYQMYSADDVKGVCVVAGNKADAYDKAVYEAIPQKAGGLPYCAWVSSVTYANGNYREFNTFAGNPY